MLCPIHHTILKPGTNSEGQPTLKCKNTNCTFEHVMKSVKYRYPTHYGNKKTGRYWKVGVNK